MLQHRYSAQLATVAERGRVEHLTTWGRSDPASSQTQKSLQQLWGISQGSVSAALTQLTALGYVVPLPRTSGQPMQYVLSGVSRLIFGSVPGEGTAAR